MKEKILTTLIQLTFAFSLHSCNLQFREKNQEDKYFHFSIKKIPKKDLFKLYKIKNETLGSLEIFLFSINYKKPTKMDEGSGFLLDAIARLHIHKHGFDLNYKSFKVIDGFRIEKKPKIDTIQYLIAFSTHETDSLSKDIEKLNLQNQFQSNEKVTDVIQFENKNETEIMECNKQRKENIENSYLKKFPNGIPDFVSESFEHEIYMNQLSCWAVVKKI